MKTLTVATRDPRTLSDPIMSELRSCVVEAMIRGYHEYQSIWEPEVGESLPCIREPSNVRDLGNTHTRGK